MQQQILGNDGILIITDCPSNVGIEFGIDGISYETGPKFKGMSMIPPGIHLIYHSTGMGSRQGFFINFLKGSIEVRNWDPINEEIISNNVLSEVSMQNLLIDINRGELNNNLGPYPYSQHSSWVNLSLFLNEGVLQRADCGFGCLVYPGDSDDIGLIKIPNPLENLSLKPYFSNSPRISKFCNIKSIQVQLRETIVLEENSYVKSQLLTDMNIDKSKILELAIFSYYLSFEDLLGELQLSYILFLTLYSYPALEQWKLLIFYICNSKSYLLSNHVFTISFIRILYEQLNFISEDFFQTEISKVNFLYPSLISLFHILNINQFSLNSTLVESRQRLLKFVNKKFNLFTEVKQTWVTLSLGHVGLRKMIDKHQFIDSDLIYLENEDDFPVIVGFDFNDPTNDLINNSQINNMDTNETIPEGENKSFMTKEEMIYSWRYPLLYESMKSQPYPEDLTMTARRIIDDFSHQDEIQNNLLRSLIIESKMFLEEETKHLN